MTCLVCEGDVCIMQQLELDLHHIALGCTIILLSLGMLGYLKVCIASSLARLT